MDGTTNSFFIYCWLCSSQQKQCALETIPWENESSSQSSTVPPVLSDLPAGGAEMEWNISEQQKIPTPPHPGVSTGWVPDPFRGGIPVPGSPCEECLGRAGASQNVPGSCRHHYHEILMISWRAQLWLRVRNNPYDKSEAKYNWKKGDGGVTIVGRQK